jgi:hypothetical protein
MDRVAGHGSCFVCGTANPHGIDVTWWADREQPGRVWTRDVERGAVFSDLQFFEATPDEGSFDADQP